MYDSISYMNLAGSKFQKCGHELCDGSLKNYCRGSKALEHTHLKLRHENE